MKFIIRSIRTPKETADYEEFDDFREDALNALAHSEFFAPEPVVVTQQEPVPLVVQLFSMLCVT